MWKYYIMGLLVTQSEYKTKTTGASNRIGVSRSLSDGNLGPLHSRDFFCGNTWFQYAVHALEQTFDF